MVEVGSGELTFDLRNLGFAQVQLCALYGRAFAVRDLVACVNFDSGKGGRQRYEMVDGLEWSDALGCLYAYAGSTNGNTWMGKLFSVPPDAAFVRVWFLLWPSRTPISTNDLVLVNLVGIGDSASTGRASLIMSGVGR